MLNALIVDDEKIIREYNGSLLREKGYETSEAENGYEASQMLTAQTDVNLVLLDVRMPVVDGTDLVEIIKMRSPKTKIVVSSVYPLDDQKRLISNADAYHQKSEGQEILLLRIDSIMSKEP